VLSAFASRAAAAVERGRLAVQAADVAVLSAADRTRTALLHAVSHDLRGPLASAKASVSSLRADDITFSPDDQDELLATADESLDRLARLVENLLDMSHVAAGTTPVVSQPVGLDDIVPHALRDLGPPACEVRVDLPDGLPSVQADPTLLGRVIAHLAANAVRHAPPDRPPRITASAHGDVVDLLVIDQGPGVPEEKWEHMFTPFQRLGDRDNSTGVGLGLAVARGLTEAMHGTLTPEDTPGGGLTMVLTLPVLHSRGAGQPGEVQPGEVQPGGGRPGEIQPGGVQ
jgi:two-component system sensor histidine kinase KdpD